MAQMAAKKNNQISLMDFVILQFFYAFQIVYESITSVLNWNFWQKPHTPIEPPSAPSNNEKRHFIQLYKSEPTERWEKPVCFMNVIEFDSSCPEEEIRKRRRSLDIQNNESFAKYQQHQRTRSNNELHRFYYSNLRY